MVGKYQEIWDADKFLRGMSTSAYSNDGGFSSDTVNINPKVTPGVIYPTVDPTDKSTNVVGNFIASCEDASASLGNDRYFVDDARHYYSYNGTSVTLQKTASTGTYTFGITDMVPFNGNFYTSTTNDITQWNGGATLDESYWTTTKAQTALKSGSGQFHPLLVFEKQLWIGDGNLLHYIDTSGTVTNSQITLAPNEAVVALGIDPGSGLMFISTTSSIAISDTIKAQYFVYLHDGYSSKPRRKIIVDDLVTAFYNVGGTVYVGFGTNLGYWAGNGIGLVRRLPNATYLNTDLPYKHHFTNIADTLYVVDGRNILAYGSIAPGRPVPYYVYKNTVNSNKLSLICNLGSGRLGSAFSSNKFYMFDTTSTSIGSGTLSLGNINFPRPISLHKVRIITTGFINAAGTGQFLVFDEKGNTFNTPAGGGAFITPAATTTYVFDFDFGGTKLQTLDPQISMTSSSFGIVRVIAYYDVAE